MNTRTPLSFSFINITGLESERWPSFRIEIRQWPLLDGSRAKSGRSTALIEAACTTQKLSHSASFPMARDVAPSQNNAWVDSLAPANGRRIPLRTCASSQSLSLTVAAHFAAHTGLCADVAAFRLCLFGSGVVGPSLFGRPSILGVSWRYGAGNKAYDREQNYEPGKCRKSEHRKSPVQVNAMGEP